MLLKNEGNNEIYIYKQPRMKDLTLDLKKSSKHLIGVKNNPNPCSIINAFERKINWIEDQVQLH